MQGVYREQFGLQKSTTPRLMMFYKAVLDTLMQALALVFVGAALFMHIENWSEDR